LERFAAGKWIGNPSKAEKNCRISIIDWLTDLLISVPLYFTCQEDIIDGTNIIQHDEGR